MVLSVVRGSDGRKPFHRKEEEALLIELRKKRIWPCFESTNLRIGVNGFRAAGYHERLDPANTLNKGMARRAPVPAKRLAKSRNSKDANASSSISIPKEGRSKHLSSYEIFVQFASPDEKVFGSSFVLL